MRIYIESNFFVPGLDDRESLELCAPAVTLRKFLERLSSISPEHIEYVKAGTKEVDKLDWDMRIDDVPYEDYERGLEHALRDGDTVTIGILAIGGG